MGIGKCFEIILIVVFIDIVVVGVVEGQIGLYEMYIVVVDVGVFCLCFLNNMFNVLFVFVVNVEGQRFFFFVDDLQGFR